MRRLTSEPAGFIGLADRGVVAAGMKADLNVIDLDALALRLPTYVRDFPGGAGRFVQRADGLRLDRGERRGAHGGRRAHRRPAGTPARRHLGGW